jgi:predicted nucleotidyltransferase component of viral defense system
MHEILKSKLAQHGGDKSQQYNYLREYLQLLILKILDEKGYFRHVAFVGGTALRILYDLNRFSEDLDFCLIDKKNFNFKEMLQVVKKELLQYHFQVDIAAKDHKNVASAFIKFNQLLSEFNLSPHASQKLSIKLEVDCRPPEGFKTEFTMLNKEFLIAINHYDLPSLFAGKLHAILYRAYIKGRDYYDLIWFIGRKVAPNYILLNHAIEQTEHVKIELSKEKLSELLQQRIAAIDFKKIQNDIEPFLADAKELRYFNQDYFLKLIK